MSTISERMQAVNARMYLEAVSGIAPADKDAFLAMCRSLEQTLDVLTTSDSEEGSGWDKGIWEDFGNWHDAPIFGT